MCECSQHNADDAAVQIDKGAIFQVDDMTCNHCAGTIRKAIAQTMPDAAVAIDLASKRVTVSGDPELAMEAIVTAGYSPLRAAH